ncbi:hypothetical protein ILYODFUR_004015 [Ilyodon furcidens]|uniref:Uncharacterized protein n=1 Tax=Ilyodon furcidens TaxID=33524 RepID=A0ABV0U6T0_9TELE
MVSCIPSEPGCRYPSLFQSVCVFFGCYGWSQQSSASLGPPLALFSSMLTSGSRVFRIPEPLSRYLNGLMQRPQLSSQSCLTLDCFSLPFILTLRDFFFPDLDAKEGVQTRFIIDRRRLTSSL